MLEPINKTRLSEAAVEQIRDLIFHRELPPGSKLPSERQLAQTLEISRASVREALRVLEIMGLIDVKPGSGAFVKDRTEDILLPLPAWLPSHKETLREHFEVRQVIEPRAAAMAAERATPKMIQEMKETLDEFVELVEADDLAGLMLVDAEFHRQVAQATGNKTLSLLMDTITQFLLEGWKASLRVPGRIEKTTEEHQRILSAIIDKDPDGASEAMAHHLKKAVADLQEMGLD